MGLKEILSTYLLDIIIVIVSLTILIGSFYKSTHRYVRGLVGIIFAGLVIYLVKDVEALNFLEYYVHQFFLLIKYEDFMKFIFTFAGKEALIGTSTFDIIHNLSMLGILGLVVFIIVNIIMGTAHSRKVNKYVKLGHYVYNKPVGSFILALLILVIGLVGTTVFLSLEFDKNYVEKSLILYNIYINLENLFNYLNSLVPAIQPLEHYVNWISGIRLGVF